MVQSQVRSYRRWIGVALVWPAVVLALLLAGQHPAGAVDDGLVPVLLKDINPGTASSSPPWFREVGSMVMFPATDLPNGQELRRTDGTAAGTVLVKDINPGAGSASISTRPAAAGGTLYFGANNGVVGTELWKSDGTAAGTVLVKDINPGASSSNPNNFILAGSTMFFTASDGTAGTELWRTDGTEDGTFMIKDINAGTGSNFGFNPPAMAAVGSTLFFPASDGTAVGGHGDELWKSDGTEAGTVLVKDIRPGTAGSGINNFSFAAMGSTVLFTANDNVVGAELWRSDGTEAGTVLVKDIFPGATGSSPSNTTVVNGVAYFSANTGIGVGGMGVELYKSDGTTEGTVLLKDIVPGGNGSFPNNFTALGTDVLFSAQIIGSGNMELFKTDGTPEGTVLLKDINPGTSSSNPVNLTRLGSTVYFSATTALNGNELWKTDGTAEGTVLSLDLNPGTAGSSPTSLTPGLGTIFFAASAPTTGNEPYRLRTNAPPVAAADSFTTRVNSTHTFAAPGVLANDTDPDGDALTAALPTRTVSDGARTAGSTTITSATAAFTAADVNASISGTGIPTGSRIVTVTDASTVTISNAATTTGTNTPLTITRQAASGTVILNPDGSFNYTPNTGFSGTDTFTYVANDGGGGTATGTVTITVAGVNTAPTPVADSYTAVEDTPLVVPAPGVLGNDTDAEGDTLTARLQGRTITDASTEFANRVISSSAAFTALDVGASITGPGLQPNARIATVVNSTTVTLTNNVTFPTVTGATMQITPQPGAATATPHGTVTLNPDGSFTYTPAANYTGGDTFTYVADDGYGATATSTVSLTVTAVNDAPVAGVDTYTTNATDPPLVVAAPGVLVNDIDVEGDSLTAGSASTPAHGAVVLNPDGSFTYTPNGTFNGVDTFTYVVSDVNGGSTTGTVNINVRNASSVDSVKGSACAYYTNVSLFGGPAGLRGCGQNAAQPATASSPAVTLPSTGSATPITATDPNGAEAEYGPATIFGGRWPEDVTSAPPSGPLAASTQGTPAGGTVTSSADISLHPTPIPVGCYAGFEPPCTLPGGFGPWPVEGDSLHVECSASKTGVSGSTTFVNAQVALATDAEGSPTVFEDVPDNPPVNYTRSGVISNVGDVFIVVYNQHILNSDGSLTVNAAHMYLLGPTAVGDMVKGSVTCGTTPSAVTAVDTVAPICGQAIVQTVSPTNPAPREPRSELVGVIDAGLPQVRTVNDGVTTNGSLTVTSATAAFAAADVGGTITGPGIPAGARIATVTNATTAVLTQASTATATGSRLEITRQAGGIQTITNVQSTNATVSVPLFTAGTTSPVAVTATRTDPSLPMKWSFDVTDTAGNVTTCRGAGNAPAAVGESYTTGEDTALTVPAPGVLANDTDFDNDTLTAVKVTDPAHGAVTLNADGSFTYTPATNYNGPDSFTYKANDGTADSNVVTVAITVSAVNDAPVAVNNTYTTAEDTVLTVAAPGVLGNDTDAEGNPLSAIKVSDPAHGTVTFNANGSFVYTPAANYTGPDSFTYKASDGTSDSNVATVSITVTAVNDAPVAADDVFTTPEDTVLTVPAPGLLANDSDIDGNTLTVSTATGTANGTLVLNPNGSLTFTPNPNFSGTNTFLYTLSDGSVRTDTGLVTITVTATNGSAFHPLTPTRILDSRPAPNTVGPYSTPWGPGTIRDVTVTGAGVPAGADAVTLNVTVTDTTEAGFLTVWPKGQARPVASSLNWAAGQTIPNAVTVKVGIDGQISIVNPVGSANVIVDLVGYYDGQPGDGYTPLTPARILDSRPAPNTVGPYTTSWGPGETRQVPVTGVGGVPANADAVVLNATVTGTTANGFLTIWPNGQAQPTASSLNWAPGQTIPNAVTVKVGAGGMVSVFNAAGNANVIFDVVGYFTPGSGQLFHPLNPTRVLDSRPPPNQVGPFNTPWGPATNRDVQIGGNGGVPASAAAALLNVTVTGGTADSFLTVWPAGQPAPLVSSLNWGPGVTIANSVTTKLSPAGAITIRNHAGNVHVIADAAGWYG